MKKYLQITAVLGFFGFLVLLRQAKGNDEQPAVVAPPTQNTSTSTSDNTAPPTAAPTTSTSGAIYKDGSYIGQPVSFIYGTLQVKAVITGGKIIDVIFLQTPNDNRTSVSINSQASVFLREEAIAAQNANVDIVSGASDSSQAFQQSLGSALAQAR